MSTPLLNWGRFADGDGRACSVKLADGGTLVINDYDNGEVIVLVKGVERNEIHQCGRREPEPGWWGRLCYRLTRD